MAKHRRPASATHTAMEVRWHHYGIWACLLALAAHVPSLWHPFVYDDVTTVLENPSLAPNVPFLFVLVYDRFRPVLNVSYALDHAIWGTNPFGFHLTNVVLHILNVALLFALSRRLLRARVESPAIIVLPALLWAVHPLTTESVGYVSGRSEVLCASFFLGALVLGTRGLVEVTFRHKAVSVLCCILAALTKEVGAAAPVVLFVIDRCVLAGEPTERRRRLLTFHGPLLLIIGIAGAVRLSAFAFVERASLTRPFGENLLTQAGVFWRYLRLAVLPVGQSILHPVRELDSLFGPELFAAIALLAAGLVVARMRGRAPFVAAGLGWFLLALMPSSLVPLNEPMAEHRTYVALPGLFLALTGIRIGRISPRGWVAATVVVITALTALTLRRHTVWRSTVTLWEDAVAKAPDVWAARYALGDAYRQQGDCRSAIVHYRAAIRLVPTASRAHNNLGICLANIGDDAPAEQAFRAAVQYAPEDASAHANLGMLALKRGDREMARRYLTRAMELDPTDERRRALLQSLGGPEQPKP